VPGYIHFVPTGRKKYAALGVSPALLKSHRDSGVPGPMLKGRKKNYFYHLYSKKNATMITLN
jgi:hypothetical protein